VNNSTPTTRKDAAKCDKQNNLHETVNWQKSEYNSSYVEFLNQKFILWRD